jgi:hypothetical protein
MSTRSQKSAQRKHQTHQRMTADAIMRFLALIKPIGTEQDTRIRDTLTDRAQRIYSSSRIL